MNENCGVLYCLHNIIYNYYGTNVFKLGKTYSVKIREDAYSTYYPELSTIMYESKQLRNLKLAESFLFAELYEYRLKYDREFFNCPLEIIKEKINHVTSLFDNFTDDDILLKLQQKQQKNLKEHIIIHDKSLVSELLKMLGFDTNIDMYSKKIQENDEWFENKIKVMQNINNNKKFYSIKDFKKINIKYEYEKYDGGFLNFINTVLKPHNLTIKKYYLPKNKTNHRVTVTNFYKLETRY
jgi:hypothetical protein